MGKKSYFCKESQSFDMDGLNIGLSFSGGGYRAAVFHLGALSFLNSINVGDGKTLLEHVSVLSTVSGGTITGLKYMLSLAKKQDINDMVDELYAFLYNENLFEDFFANLEKGRTKIDEDRIVPPSDRQKALSYAAVSDGSSAGGSSGTGRGRRYSEN